MRNHTLLTRLFFGASFALMAGVGVLVPTHRAMAQEDEIAPGDDQGVIIIVVDRCPGQTQPVCRTQTSGGTTNYYYFP